MGRPKGKPSKGQPQGARSASGRLRDREPGRVDPCEGVIRRRQFYGIAANDGALCDAIGRAHAAGLLGTGERAQDLLNAGRKVAWQYWHTFGFSTPDSLARFQPRNPSTPMDPERQKVLEDALNIALDMVRAKSRDHRSCFDQLVIDINPDSGPPWLDRIIAAHRERRTATERDANAMKLAREALEVLA